MKFLCDRCKTRYSIGDDRVRGKILKIRCKNCANVITVREGMPDADAADAEPDVVPMIKRSARSTTMAPPEQREVPAPPAPPSQAPSATGAAAAATATKPPAALEEEWYVSIDGDQQGPFSLAEAQAWVGKQAPDADLHCWSEGFDDWLPVDKVSHFRGTRKKAIPPPPRPVSPPTARAPRQTMSAEAKARFGAAGGPAGEGAGPVEDPKPLFAATMASIDTGPSNTPLPGHLPSAVPKLASLVPPPTPSAPVPPKATPPAGIPVNGASASTPPTIPAGKSQPLRVPTVQGVGTSPISAMLPPPVATSGSAALARAWDASERDVPTGEPPTTAEAAPFGELAHGHASPGASSTLRDDRAAASAGHAHAGHAGQADPDDGDDDLDIGEVSRVVNLADLARQATQKKERTAPVRRATAADARITGLAPKFLPADLGGGLAPAVPLIGADGAPIAAAEAPVVAASAEAAAPPPAVQKRTMVIMLGVAGVLLVGLVVLVVMLVGNRDDDDYGGGLGHVGQVDTQRPDDPFHKIATPPDQSGSATVPVAPIHHNGGTFVGPAHPGGSNTITTNPGDGGKTEVDLTRPGAITALKPEEVEDMSAKQGMGTQRCYEQALKKDPFLDVKRISVTLSVDAAGGVTDVKLSDHDADMLGKCLGQRIRGWKFRQSTAGIIAKITMVFSQG